jgi:Uncharacterized conserved protein (COG2071)
MRLPVIRGVIDRRILVNYRVDPDRLAAILPPPFRPQLVGGYGIAGICLIRLRDIRPRGLPRWLGLSSENAANRIAVEWDDGGQRRQGVYVIRRDTSSRLNALAGGRVFPGVHHYGRFAVHETNDGRVGCAHQLRLDVSFQSNDSLASTRVVATTSDRWPRDSVFASVADASTFFAAGSLGFSPAAAPGHFQGLELRCRSWQVTPLTVESVRSSLFDDKQLFPLGSVTLDCALLMRDIEHEWHSREDLCCALTQRTAA